ncbi:MAG: hypothetical protein N2444_01960 [Methylocystis sp.]|nr:hypothetical protein [Methylocystis sp.]
MSVIASKSATAFEAGSVPAPPPLAKPLRARPLGLRAALGMGASASFILLAALVFGGARRGDDALQVAGVETAAVSEAPQAKPKIAAKADSAEPPAVAPLPPIKPVFSAFDVKAAEFAQVQKTVATRDGDDGAGRVDSVTLGEFASGATFMRVDVHQGASEKESAADYFLDMKRHAGLSGLDTVKIGSPSDLQTRFGAFEAAEIRLAKPASDGAAAIVRNCLAGRLVAEESGLIITSVACGADDRPLDRVAFGCLIDRLDYSATGDEKLDAFFARAGASRNCNVSRDDMTATVPEKTSKQRRRRR